MPRLEIYDIHPLFEDVQMQRIFHDGKTFVDCTPKFPLEQINRKYKELKQNPGFSLESFVLENFELPANPANNYQTGSTEDVVSHIKKLWKVLQREPDVKVSPTGGDLEGAASTTSLLPLPYPYIVPGGRFREIYYWDSYFTMLGLRESAEYEMIENMVKNFSYLIETYGHIPNGNRSYYLSRSQPPFFAAMVNLLAELRGDVVWENHLPALEKEYSYWMEGAGNLSDGQTYRRVVKLGDGAILNRYWDDNPAPRQESYREDVETAEQAVINFLMATLFTDADQQEKATANLRTTIYRHLRAGAESGIDFSSRWFEDGENITTIQTTDFIPVDLNALMYNLEMTISNGKARQRDKISANEFAAKAEQRKKAIIKYCYNHTVNFFTDYNYRTQERSPVITPGGMYPFCFFENDEAIKLLAKKIATTLKNNLLKDGGIVTTVNHSGQQWDAPNGWAPLQWMTIWALNNLEQKGLAREIARRWIRLNVDVYKRTGKLMEKYNVIDTNLEAGGGEYPSQDGFGWTNGVLLKLIGMYGIESGVGSR